MAIKNPVWAFFQTEAPVAVDNAIGRGLAVKMVAEFKAKFPEYGDDAIVGFLFSWNDRWGSEFTEDDLKEFSRTPARATRHRAKKPNPANFAVELFGDNNA